MLTIRVTDARMMALQRQGRIGFYGEAMGQEAAVVGSAAATLPDDWIIPALREAGLAVTVVRDADRRSIFDLSCEVERLGEAVRAGTATREELMGSTFTISSLGKLGGVLATPIINFPEVAILGVHKIEEKPAVRNGQIVIRHLMNLSISVDHRLADGWDGAMFLQDVKALLEDPTTMFMEMV